MAVGFDRALTRFITTCAHVRAVPDLITKWRLELPDGQAEPSTLTGDAGHDLEEIRLEIEAFLGGQTVRRLHRPAHPISAAVQILAHGCAITPICSSTSQRRHRGSNTRR